MSRPMFGAGMFPLRGFSVLSEYRTARLSPGSRPVGPSGSVVSELDQRLAVRRKALPPASIPRMDAVWRRQRDKLLRRIRARHGARIVSRGGVAGIGGAGFDDIAEAVGRGMEMADTAGMSATERAEAGYNLLATRAGEIAAATGIVVDAEMVARNAFREFQRANDLVNYARDGSWLPEGFGLTEILESSANEMFREWATVVWDQQLPLPDVRAMWSDMTGLYGSLRSGGMEMYSNISRVARDAAAQAEGGLRDMMTRVVGGLDGIRGVGGEWLTRDNLDRASRAVNAWVQAASRGTPMDYVSAAGTTAMSIGGGLSMVQPAGSVVTAVGAGVSFFGAIAALFDPPDTPPPPIEPRPMPMVEAWTVLGYYVSARDGAIRTPRELKARGWSVTVDPATGETLVRNSRENVPEFVRVMDVFDRRMLADVAVFDALSAMPMWAWDDLLDEAGLGGPGHWMKDLWSSPNQRDIITPFIGAEQCEHEDVARLRLDGASPKRALGDDMARYRAAGFRPSVCAASYVAAYLGGCGPYGVALAGGHGLDYAISTGVGGDAHQPGERDPVSLWTGLRPTTWPATGAAGPPTYRLTRPFAAGVLPGSSGVHAVPQARNVRVIVPATFPERSDLSTEMSSRRKLTLPDLFTLMRDPYWRKIARIPGPSPRAQTGMVMLPFTTADGVGVPRTDDVLDTRNGGDGLGPAVVIGGVGLAALLVWALTK